jgi:hypothetical protein
VSNERARRRREARESNRRRSPARRRAAPLAGDGGRPLLHGLAVCPGRQILHDSGWAECDTCTDPEAFHLVAFTCGVFGYCPECDGPCPGCGQ